MKRALSRAIVVSPEELDVTEIVCGQPLTEIPDVLGLPKATEIKELSNPALSGTSPLYIPSRALHAQKPLSDIAEPLGLEVYVRFYEINGIPIYFVEEPPVTELVKKLYVYFKSRLGEVGLTGGNIIKFVTEEIEDMGLNPKYVFMEPEFKAAVYYVWRDLLGYGPLEIPMEDPDVEEVSWFSHDGPVLVVDKSVAKKYPNAEFVFTNIFIPKYVDDVKKKFIMNQVVRGITSKGKSGLTVAKPLAETRIPDPSGIGFHRVAAHSDITSRSSGITIRKFPHVKLNLVRLISEKSLNELMAAYLLMQLIKRGFVLVVGGMASGKTTLLQALISSLPISYKVVTIEDTPELSTPSQNWHPLYVRRAPKLSEMDDVDYSRLVIHSLRHRGTIVTLGEARGEEFAYLIQASASGHGAICLRRDAKLIVKDGRGARLVDIADIEELAQSGEVHVLSYDVVKGKAVWKPIVSFFKTRSDKWVIIKTEAGRTIEATPDHMLPVVSDGRIVMKPARSVRPGDKLIVVASLPKHSVTRYIVVSGLYVVLSKHLGVLFGAYLMGGVRRHNYVSLPDYPKVYESALHFTKTYGMRVEASRGRVRIHGGLLARVLDEVARVVSENPLSLPDNFIEGVYSVISGAVVSGDERLLHGLHFALKTIGVDSVVGDGKLRVLGRGGGLDTVVEVSETRGGDDAFDIEVSDTHTFVTNSSIVSGNCTFHAHDPFSIFARITSPPINASPESLKLISSVVHVAYAKTFARGKPEAVRRVMRIFEIRDVNKIREGTGGYEIVFEWDPLNDVHSPRLFDIDGSLRIVEPLVELWNKSETMRTLGRITYSDKEAERILMDVLALALFLRDQVDKKVFDMRQLMFNITAFYLEMDSVSSKLWEKLKYKILPETRGSR